MTENMKKFLEKVSNDKTLTEKASKLNKAGLIVFARELGFELTEADFEGQEGELEDAELDAVAGGSECACVVGGGGTAEGDCPACACVVAGFGSDAEGLCRCACPFGGVGAHRAGSWYD